MQSSVLKLIDLCACPNLVCHQPIDQVQERIKMLTKHTSCYKFFSEIKTIWKTKTDTKEHTDRQNINICIRNLDTNKEKKKATEHFWEEMYRRILGPVYENEIENWRILTNKQIYAILKILYLP
jgi:heterodisulfide reductase subunit B